MEKTKILIASLAFLVLAACSGKGGDSAPPSATPPPAAPTAAPAPAGPPVDYLYTALAQKGAIVDSGAGFFTIRLIGALSDKDKDAGGGCRMMIYVDNAQQSVLIMPDVRQDDDGLFDGEITYRLMISRGDHHIVAAPAYEDQHQETITAEGTYQTVTYIDAETKKPTSRMRLNFDGTGKLRSFTLVTKHQKAATCELYE